MKKLFIALFLSIIIYSSHAQNTDNEIFPNFTIQISPLNINSDYSDIGAFLVNDTLFFSSYRSEGEKKYKPAKKRYYDLFQIGIDNEGNPAGKRQIVNEFCTYFHDGPVAWCEKTGELFVTQSHKTNANAVYGFTNSDMLTLRILAAKKENNRWKVVEEFPFNSLEYSVAHPALTINGDTMIFASDMAGGYGGTDLYMSTRDIDRKWNAPRNMGKRINSPGKEEFPFVTYNNGKTYLIFSSDEKPGLGGLDLFYTELNNNTTEINHFAAPINSNKDDFGLTFDLSLGFGYLISNRNNNGDDDIYKVTLSIPQPLERTIYVFDRNSQKPIKVATVVIDNKESFFTDKEGKISFTPSGPKASVVQASAFGYNDNSVSLSELNPYRNNCSTDTIWMEMITNKTIILKNIYYDLDSWEILPESAAELDKLVNLMNENPKMNVELGSHTDSRGSNRYNRRLSRLRAEAVALYIVNKGIAASRIKAIGYGESKPLFSCPNWKECTPEQNRENRRTEIFIPGFGKSEKVVQKKGDYTETKSVNKSGIGAIHSAKTTQVVLAQPDPESFDYYLIFGSFSFVENAEKEINNLKALGVEAKLMKENTMFRVGLGFNKLSEAKALQQSLKEKYPSAWIL